MNYASKQDIDDLYGEDLLRRVTDHDDDGESDSPVIARGLADASAVIDSYISARYTLPLISVPSVLKKICIDLGIYSMAPQDSRRTTEMRQRYEDAMAMLRDIASGKSGLGLVDDGTGNPTTPTSAPLTRMRGGTLNAARA
jgi:phage gp36-like protein